jgi:hypothetical protein
LNANTKEHGKGGDRYEKEIKYKVCAFLKSLPF